MFAQMLELSASVPVQGLVGIAMLGMLLMFLSRQIIPAIDVEVGPEETDDVIETKASPRKIAKDSIPCYDPSTMQYLGRVPAMKPAQVHQMVARAKAAALEWKSSSFVQRKLFLNIILKYIIDNQETICRVAARDSGKPMVDAAFGEVMVTCEKLWWLAHEGEQYLKPDKRSAGRMMFYKKARVEYHPVGVVGAIVPWNYPFHNVFNPLSAAVFAGNAIVIKVSEHASWSSLYYGRIISAALAAVGAPPDLVQIVTGYGDAGHALVTSGVGKLVFVGSTGIGRKVMESAAGTLTPVVLELGGKDAFIVCDDADLDQTVPTALRGTFQSCGQNCAGAERFIVHERVYEQFKERVAAVARKLRQGPATGAGMVDCGAMCLPGLAEKVQELVDDAVEYGAEVLAGGQLPAEGNRGQFYPPTILAGVTPSMRIWQEEVFGPVMAIVACADDEEAVRLANDCPFGLGSAVFSGSKRRANAIARQLEAGMTSINDFATTYMCQSLPFGGVKESGFDRFAGIEGLRGLCVPKAVCEDRWPFKTNIPPMLQYPVSDKAFGFVCCLIRMFYGLTLRDNLAGLFGLAGCFVPLPWAQRAAGKKTNGKTNGKEV